MARLRFGARPMTEQDKLLKTYMNKFFEVHGYQITFLPNPVTMEWITDQLDALNWYRRYEIELRGKPEPKEPAVKKTKKQTVNPFA
jgi:hypothetical protein